jgi:hypothetical protein
MAGVGLKVQFAVVHLTGILLIDRGEGSGRYWDRWSDCITGIKHLPDRSEYLNVFVGQMQVRAHEAVR